MKKHFKRSLSILLSVLTLSLSLPAFTAAADEAGDLYILGDITCDGKITLKDASYIQKVDLGLQYLSRSRVPIADVNGDDECTLSDAYIVQKYVLGIEMDYPVNKDGQRIGDAIRVIVDESDTGPDTDTEDTDSTLPDTDPEETDSIVSDIDSENTDSVVSDIDTDDTESDVPYTDTDDTESDVPYTDIDDTESDVPYTDTDDTESDIPVVELLPLEQINEEMNGDFEDGTDALPDGWENFWGYMKASAAPGEGVGGSRALKISHPSKAMSFAVHHVTGLEPGKDYKYKVMVKADNVERKTENGICVDVGTCLNGMYVTGRGENGGIERGKGYMMYPSETSLAGSFDWKEITCWFVPDAYGRADIVLYLDAQGTVWFDNVVIETADFDSEVTAVRRFEGEHTGIIIYQEDIADLNEEDIKAWVDDLDYAYEQEADLMGAVPFCGDKIYFASSQEMMVMQFQALGGINPLKWNRNYMKGDCRN